MGGQAADEVNLRDLAIVLHAHWRLVASIFLLCLIAGGAAAALLPPRYFASALVLVDVSRKELLDPAHHAVSGTSENARLDSEVEILGSDGVLMQTIRSEALTEDPEFAPRQGVRTRVAQWAGASAQEPGSEVMTGHVLDRFRNAVSVQRRGQTHVISVGVRSREAAKAARLANALAHNYIANQLKTKIGNLRAAHDIIVRQGEEARVSLVRAETDFGRFIFDNLEEIVALSGRGELRDMHRRVSELSAQRLELANQVSAFRDEMGLGSGTLLGGTAKLEAAQLLEPARFEFIGENLSDTLRQQLAAAKASLETTETAVATERQALVAAVMTTTLPPHILAQLYGLQQAARNATVNYQTLLARSLDLETQASLQIADSRIVSAALSPAKPSLPNVTLMLALACVAGLGLGVTSAFVMENLAGGFRSIAQAQTVLAQRLCVALPVERKPSGAFSVADGVVAPTSSDFSNAVQRLRASVELAQQEIAGAAQLQDATGRVVLVMSATAGEGRSTVALALARAYARTGARVLIVDCSQSNGGISRLMGLPAAEPTQILGGRWPTAEDFRTCGLIDSLSSVVVVASGSATAPPGLDPLIVAARQTFDHIIVDCPCLDEVVEDVSLPSRADTAILVSLWGRTAQSKVQSALHRLSAIVRSATDPVVVLNHAPRRRR